jgi:hypothetical protein
LVYVAVLVLSAGLVQADGIHQDLTDTIPPARGPDDPGRISWEANIPMGHVIRWNWTANGSIDFRVLGPGGAVLVNETGVDQGSGSMDADGSGVYRFQFLNGDEEQGYELTYTVHAAQPQRDIVSLELCLVAMAVPIIVFVFLLWRSLRRRGITFREWLGQMDRGGLDGPGDRRD